MIELLVVSLLIIGLLLLDEEEEETKETTVSVETIYLDDEIEKNGKVYKMNFTGPIDGDNISNEDLQKPLFAEVS